MATAERLRSVGMQEGELKKARKIAKNLRRLNMNKKIIMEVTDFSNKEIEGLKKKCSNYGAVGTVYVRALTGSRYQCPLLFTPFSPAPLTYGY